MWAVGELSHLGDLMFHQKLCTRCDAWVCVLLWWSCQSPVAHSCGLLNHLNSFHRWMFKLNSKFDADSLLCLLSYFECDGTEYTGSLNGDHHPHWLVQWSHHCSPVHIPVHSPCLPAYINVMQSVLIILTMTGLFPDRPGILHVI